MKDNTDGKTIKGSYVCCRAGLMGLAATLALSSTSALAHDGHHSNIYLQTNLVSDLPGLAQSQDTNLVNPWGISFSSTSPF